MARATNASGALQELVRCRIITPYGTIRLKVLPEISDSKSANYVNEPIPGRATPPPTYSHSDPRQIQTELTFIVTQCQDIEDNLMYLRMIKSLVYPGPAQGGAPYKPPPICKLICGKVLGDGDEDGVCVILKSYSYKGQTDVPWDEQTYLPYKFNVSCSWEVVYSCDNLPTNVSIRQMPEPINWTCPPPP